MEWPTITLADVVEAKRRIGPYLRPTPLYRYAGLDELLGAEVWVKHENHQPVGAFKVRGGVNLVSQLGEDERRRGLIAASTGNHGQSVAYAARLFGVTARICVPEGANPVKLAAMRALGAELIVHGPDFDAAREHCERLAAEHGYRYVHSGNEPHPDRGRRHRDARDPRGPARRRGDRRPDRRRQRRGGRLHRREGDPAVDRGDRRPVRGGAGRVPLLAGARAARGRDIDTFAEGLATRVPFELPQQILWEHLDDFVLVSEDEIRERDAADDRAHAQSRRAGRRGAAGGGAEAGRPLRGARRIALIASGGNISPAQLAALYR